MPDESRLRGRTSEPLAGIHVLIVDDHDDTRDLLEQTLRFQGAIVTSVATAREALAAVPEAAIVVAENSLGRAWRRRICEDAPHT